MAEQSRPDPRDIAREIKQAQDEVRQIEPFTSRWNGFDNALAYRAAGVLHQQRLEEGAAPVGRKIGFTNPEMWTLYGVTEPVWAHVYDRTVVHLSGIRADCALGRFAEPKIEPEIVVHFHSPPPQSADPAEILASIDWIAHGLEVVQSHFPGWRFQAADTIADSALHATLLVGEPHKIDQLGGDTLCALRNFTLALSCNGDVRELGRGSNVLGSPLLAVAHLVAVLAGQPAAPALQAGELVTTGTLSAALPVSPGETWTTLLEGIALPGLSVTFLP